MVRVEKAEALRLVLLSGSDEREGRKAGNGADNMAGLKSLGSLWSSEIILKIIVEKPQGFRLGREAITFAPLRKFSG